MVFVVLLTRVILSYKLDFLIPLSKVDENMKVAQKRDAVLQGMFYFRKDICKGGSAVVDGYGQARNSSELAAEEYTLMSIDTIINGKVGAAPRASAQPCTGEGGLTTRPVSCRKGCFLG